MKVMIGVDPHKGSHTAVAIDDGEDALAQVKVRASRRQVDQLLEWAAPFEERTWAIESAGGLGCLLAQQLVAAGEEVLDVPATLAARVRVLGTGRSTRVYVPNGESATVDVIDPTTFEVVDSYPVGRLPQHVVPSYDMQTLYVNNIQGNSLTPIDPRTGKPGPEIPVDDPYNLYFSPDGSQAIVIAERNSQIDFRDPQTWELVKRLDVPAEYRDEGGDSGVNHAEFTADGKTMIASCEFSGWLIRVDLETMEVTGGLKVGGKPVDLKLSPDGTVVFNANETRNGVSVIDWTTMQELAFIPTGAGTHGLYPSRNGTLLYATNRLGGSVSVIDFGTRQVVDTWEFGGSPDMGGVSTDGTQLWLSGRYNSEVYVIDTSTGELIRRINVGGGPHGLAIFPQPGRFSMGTRGTTAELDRLPLVASSP